MTLEYYSSDCSEWRYDFTRRNSTLRIASNSTYNRTKQCTLNDVAIDHPFIDFPLPLFFLSLFLPTTIYKIADSSDWKHFHDWKTRRGNFRRTKSGKRGGVKRAGIFAVVGCEISITRVPEADSIIEAGLITDSIVATSAPRNLFLFALKRTRRIYYAARSSARLCLRGRTLWHLFPVLYRRVTSFYHTDIPCNFLFPVYFPSLSRFVRPPVSPTPFPHPPLLS